MSQPIRKSFRDLTLSQKFKLVFLGLGVLCPLFAIATVKPVSAPVAVQLGCLTSLLLLRSGWLGGSYIPAVVAGIGFLIAFAATYASVAF
jgi:hypothetical protein